MNIKVQLVMTGTLYRPVPEQQTMSIPNGYGENMPDDITIRLTYRQDGTLSHCQAPSARVRDDDGVLARLATVYSEATRHSICVSRDAPDTQQFNTLTQEERSFIYFDVGRWGGRRGESGLAGSSQHREFGVVCGCYAALCKFSNRPGRAPEIIGSDDSARLIQRLLASLCTSSSSVRIIKHASIHSSLQPPMGAPVYVFLGDIHLPIITSIPQMRQRQGTRYMDSGRGVRPIRVAETQYELVGSPEPCMGRVTSGSYELLRTDNASDVRSWHQSYINGDIFRGGANDLLTFLTLLERSPERRNIHFFQLGDLYDLWIGLAPFFQPVSGPPGAVRLIRGRRGRGQPTAREFIDYWMSRANQCYPRLTAKLTNLNVGQKTFLYGNHDNYLARYAPGLQGRPRSVRQNHIYAEHGHWVDSSNYDGASGTLGGHRVTDYVFAMPTLRAADPQRRHYYTTSAAIEYTNRRDFGIFVMGHTHMPYLTRVRVEVSRQSLPPPSGGPRDLDGGVSVSGGSSRPGGDPDAGVYRGDA